MKVTNETGSAAAVQARTGPSPDVSASTAPKEPTSAGAVSADAGPVDPQVGIPPAEGGGKDYLAEAGVNPADLLGPDEQGPVFLDERHDLLNFLGSLSETDENLLLTRMPQVIAVVAPLVAESPEETLALAAETAEKLGVDLENMSIYDLIALLIAMVMESGIKNTRQFTAGAAAAAQSRMEHMVAQVFHMKEKAAEGLKSAGEAAGMTISFSTLALGTGYKSGKMQAKLDADKGILGRATHALEANNNAAAQRLLNGSSINLDGKTPGLSTEARIELLRKSIQSRTALAHVAQSSPQIANALGSALPAVLSAQGNIEMAQEEADATKEQTLGAADADLENIQTKGGETSSNSVSGAIDGLNRSTEAVNNVIPRMG